MINRKDTGVVNQTIRANSSLNTFNCCAEVNWLCKPAHLSNKIDNRTYYRGLLDMEDI